MFKVVGPRELGRMNKTKAKQGFTTVEGLRAN